MDALKSVVPALILVATLGIPHVSHAQFGFQPDILTVSMSPAHPRPNEVVTLTVHSASSDIGSNTIVWSVDGSTVAQGQGVASVNVTAGSLGSRKVVIVTATNSDGSVAARADIIPTEIDLLWESHSYVPPFYSARASVSSGSSVRLHALARLVPPGGSALAAEELTYTWRRNGEVVGSISGRGRATATLHAPLLFGADSISVEASSPDKTMVALATVRIPSREARLHLYENHPLFGVLFHNALRVAGDSVATEASFVALPYYAHTGPTNPQLAYDWRINGAPVVVNTSFPNEITIDATGSLGVADIQLTVTSNTNVFLDTSRVWNITFGRAADGSINDPFRIGL